jgi:hypothetical protein
MSTFLQQRFQSDSTRGISELLILDIVSRLGQASLADVHEALRRVTEGSPTIFFTGQPLRKVLDNYRDLKQVQIVTQSPEPTYTLTPAAATQIRHFEVKLNDLFPQLQHVGRR